MTRGTLNLLGKPRAMTADGREASLPPLSFVLAGFLLLEQPLGMASRNDIAAFLWRDAIQTRASLNLHRLIFQIIEAQSSAEIEYFLIGADKISINYSSIEIDIFELEYIDEIVEKSRRSSIIHDMALRGEIALMSGLPISDVNLTNWIRKINRAHVIALAGIQFLENRGAASIPFRAGPISKRADRLHASHDHADVDARLRALFSSWGGGRDARCSFVSYLRHVLTRVDEETIADLGDRIRTIALQATPDALEARSGVADDESREFDGASSAQREYFVSDRSFNASSLSVIGETREPTLSFSSIVLPPELSESYARFILSEASRRISNQLLAHDFTLVTRIDPEIAAGQRSVTEFRHIPSGRLFYIKVSVDNTFDQVIVNTDVFSDFGKQITRVLTNVAIANSTSVIDAVTNSVLADVRGLDGGDWGAPKAEEACARLVRFGRRMLHSLDAPSLRRALACFESALRIAPDAPAALAGASRACVLEWFTQLNPKSDRLDRAEDHARRIIEIHPDLHVGYQALGYVQLYRRRFDASVENITRALEMDPGNDSCISDLAATLLYTGRPAAAIDILRPNLASSNAGDEIDHWTAAGANYTLENYKEAIRHLAAIREPRIGTRLVASSHAMLNERELANFHANFGKACNPGFQLASWLPMLPIANPSQLRHYEEGLRSAGFT